MTGVQTCALPILSSLLGANRRFIDDHLPHMGGLLRADIASVIDESDVLIVGSGEKRLTDQVRQLARPQHCVIDLAHIGEHADLVAKYVGLTWK